ncbi:ThuA domain-containing protein [Lentisphaera marina]|uniref:ThuA domain-containing protein n=1 Tax=Lentisphaera marina TaxID=1111041 RepID=UPI00236635FC|nr:ThuA domain-containing protein [Lentisphaera marina]MDD7984663.1 ThuA domain-containing protein [Lentisphaera marina]
MKNVLIVSGGWLGHKPYEFADFFDQLYKEQGFEVIHSHTLDSFNDLNFLKSFDILMPNWTMGEISDEQENNISEAIKSGVNLLGIHGGAGDAFRSCLTYQWMLGGQFLAHPYVGEYEVRITQKNHPICLGISASFTVDTEQYYMLTEPSIEVLAETRYIYEDQTMIMPVAWVKNWGQGKVFYSTLGHEPSEYDKYPEMKQLLTQAIRFLT